MSDDTQITVERNDARRRYEIRVGDTIAGFTTFHPDDEGRLLFPHTEIDPAFSGRGLGSRLVSAAMEDASARGETVVPVCPFVVKYLRGTEVPGLSVDWDTRRNESDAAAAADTES